MCQTQGMWPLQPSCDFDIDVLSCKHFYECLWLFVLHLPTLRWCPVNTFYIVKLWYISKENIKCWWITILFLILEKFILARFRCFIQREHNICSTFYCNQDLHHAFYYAYLYTLGLVNIIKMHQKTVIYIINRCSHTKSL